MPDLTTESFWCCSSVLGDEQEVPSSDGSKVYLCYWEPAPHSYPYSMWWRCGANNGEGCWPWRKNRTCRHTEQAEKQWCGWDTGPGIGDIGEPVEVVVHEGWLDGVLVWQTDHASQAIIWRDEARADLKVEQRIERRCPRCGKPATAQNWGV